MPAETKAERSLREAQIALETEAYELPMPNKLRGALIALAGRVLQIRGDLERLRAAA